jgi:hypothetical protein
MIGGSGDGTGGVLETRIFGINFVTFLGIAARK